MTVMAAITSDPVPPVPPGPSEASEAADAPPLPKRARAQPQKYTYSCTDYGTYITTYCKCKLTVLEKL